MNSMGLSKKVLGVPVVMKSRLLRIHGAGEQCFAPLHSGLRKTLCNPMVSVHTYTIKDPLETSKTRTPRVVASDYSLMLCPGWAPSNVSCTSNRPTPLFRIRPPEHVRCIVQPPIGRCVAAPKPHALPPCMRQRSQS